MASLWAQLIPQASVSSPFIRHAMIAVSALEVAVTQTRRSKDVPLLKEEEESLTSNRHWALKQYGTALNLMRKALEDGLQDVRSVLIACLLYFSFETIQSCQWGACSLARSGLRLLQQYKPTDLDSEIISAFASLEINLSSFLSRPALILSYHQSAIDNSSAIISGMPKRFSDIETCHYYWKLLLSRR